ncbi:MFS transporter [Schaalia naturae]|uniref:MFS transporter n=1 Tax=Schaalia naturae TaxID=635203 RepID=A0ABW2SMZ9_9ACTO
MPISSRAAIPASARPRPASPDPADVEGDAGAADAGTRRVPLSRNSAFTHLWAGETASQFGFQVAALATSAIAITVLGATERQIGVLGALQTVAFLLIGLPAGAWVDRWRKRRTMIAADLVRVAALASIPIAWAAGALSIWHLMAVAAVLGFATVFFDVSYQSFVPAIVDNDQIGPANGRMEASFQVARVGGPGLAGWLLGIVAAPVAYLLTAATYAFSAIAIWRIPGRESRPPAPRDQKLWHQVREGIDYVSGEPLLGPLFLCISAAALTGQGVQTLLPLLALRNLGMSATALGTLLSLGALGGIAGALVQSRVVLRLGEGHTIVACNVAGALALAGLPLTVLVPPSGAALVLVVTNLVSSFFITIYNITQMSLRQRICSPELLGRLNATFRFAVWGVMPIGSLLSGVAASHLGVVGAMAVFVAGSVLAGLSMGLTPVAHRNRIDNRALVGAA